MSNHRYLKPNGTNGIYLRSLLGELQQHEQLLTILKAATTTPDQVRALAELQLAVDERRAQIIHMATRPMASDL